MNLRKKSIFKLSFSALAVMLVMNSCKQEVSSSTGWNYNDTKNGGFEVVNYVEQETGPGRSREREGCDRQRVHRKKAWREILAAEGMAHSP